MSRVWSKFDERGLARLVMPEAASFVKLPLVRADLPDSADGRRHLVEAIYAALLGFDIHYAPEQYHPELAEQLIRSPHEILASPGEGTCLDLATLFAGLCLGFELVPVVVVTETHALCAVSLSHGVRSWDAFDRRERESFEVPVTDTEVLRQLVDSGAYLAIECTGFSRSDTLPVDSIEGSNRHDGFLSFQDAVAAGRRQLDRADSPLRFAIDVAVAHYHWKLLPPTLPADYQVAVEGLIAARVGTDLRLDKDRAEHAIRAYPRPITPLIAPPRHFVDRRHELASVRTGMSSDSTVWVRGSPGIGKTALLRKIAHDSEATPPDGVVYLTGVSDPEDAGQQIWESFYNSDTGYKPTRTRLAQAVGGVNALVLIDDAELSDVDPLLDLTPQSKLVVVPSGDLRRGGGVVELEGLDDDAAVELFESTLGRPLAPDERPRAQAICRSLEAHPAKVIDAATLLSDGSSTLDRLVESTRVSAETPSRERLASLGEVEREIVTLVGAFGSSGLGRDHVEALMRPEAAAGLARLVDLRVLETASPRYRLAATWMGEVVDTAHLERARVAASAHFSDWARSASPEEVARSLPEMMKVISWARESGDLRTVLAVGPPAEMAAALTRRWGAWGEVLDATLSAARALGERSAEAHALHQLGTRARLLGDRRAARRHLKEARRIRRELGERAGAELSSHNLALSRLVAPWVVGGALVAGLLATAAAACTLTDVCFGPSDEVDVFVDPEAIVFEDLVIGSGSRAEVVAVRNRGEVPATLLPGTFDGDPVFELSEDCPDVLAPDTSCSYVVSFAPTEPGSYAGTLEVGVEGAEPLLVGLSGAGLEPADVTIDPVQGDFGVVAVGMEDTMVFTVTNNGDVAANTLGPATVEGEFFEIESDGCDGPIEGGGGSCTIVVVFRPERDPDADLEDRTHTGVLRLPVDPPGVFEISLRGTSSFLLPDLTIQVDEATPIGRTSLGPIDQISLVQQQVDLVVFRVAYTISNGGKSAAGGFLVSGERLVGRVWQPAFLSGAATSLVAVSVDSEIAPGESTSFTGFLLVPRGDPEQEVGAAPVEPTQPFRLRLMVDSCAGEESPPEGCRVRESDEGNNLSADVDANPIVARTEVPYDRLDSDGGHRSLFRETFFGDLVADALQWEAFRLAEEQGWSSPVAFLDAAALVPPGRDRRSQIGPGDLRMLDLVDIVPRGFLASSEAADPERVADIFATVLSGWPNNGIPFVPAGGFFDWCSTANTGEGELVLYDLVLADIPLMDEGSMVTEEPVAVLTTDRFAFGTYADELPGFAAHGTSRTLVEVLRDYIVTELGGVIGPNDVVMGRRADRCGID